MRDAVQTVIFVAMLALPSFGLVFGWNDPSLVRAENRTPSAWPGLPRDRAGLVAFPARFDSWFRDHFGFRSHLIRVAKRAEPVIVGGRQGVFAGRDGWLFWGDTSDLDRHRCVRLEEDAASWQRLAEARQSWFAARGLPFVWAVAPSKHTVYPEFLPEAARGDEARPCALDALPRALAGAGAALLDLRPVLRDRKRDGRLFHRKDTHWNQLGAFHGARAILDRVTAGSARTGLDDFEVIVREGVARGNLANYFAARGETHLEDVVVLLPRGARRAHPVEGSPPLDPEKHTWQEKRIVLETGDPALPSALVFHDSFGYTAMPFLAEHFRRVVFVHSLGALDGEVIEVERPDVVILLNVETRFLTPPPADRLDRAQRGPERRDAGLDPRVAVPPASG